MKVFLSSLGCKLNEGELESWSRQFVAEGNEIVDDAGQADLCVLNTCTVTHVAARKSRALVKRIAESGKNAKILVTGCYATMSPDEARSLPNVSLLVPNSDKDRLVTLSDKLFRDTDLKLTENGCRLLESIGGLQSPDSTLLSPPVNTGPPDLPHRRTRAFVKIEDGCNLSCTYCIIPLARGRARSRPQQEIVNEIRELVADGYQEVILTGVQISDFNLDERAAGRGRLQGLCSLIRDILGQTELNRLRLTSIAPWDLEDGLLDLFANPRLCRHLHLSLQSGSDGVLRRMRRPYTTEQFSEAVMRARTRVPGIGITTDLIVGFPGETDAEFEESRDFVKSMHFSRIHIFPYSARLGTVAAQLPHQVSDAVKTRRAKTMQSVAASASSTFASSFEGQVQKVLYETEAMTSGSWWGYTDNYVRVLTRSSDDLSNRILPTRISHVDGDAAHGSLELDGTAR